MRTTNRLFVIFGVILTFPAFGTAEDDKKLARAKDFSQLSFNAFGLAFHNFASAYEDMRLPLDIIDKNGKPLLSWRVAILPFLELSDLYRIFPLTFYASCGEVFGVEVCCTQAAVAW